MSEEPLNPTPDTSKSEEVKPADVRHAQVEQAKSEIGAPFAEAFRRKAEAREAVSAVLPSPPPF